MTTHFGDQLDVLALPVNTVVGAWPGANTMSEGGSAAAVVLWTEAVDLSDTDYKSKYGNFSDVCRFNAMFSNGRNAIMYG